MRQLWPKKIRIVLDVPASVTKVVNVESSVIALVAIVSTRAGPLLAAVAKLYAALELSPMKIG